MATRFLLFGIGSDEDVTQTYYAYVRNEDTGLYLDADDNTFKTFATLVDGTHDLTEDPDQLGCYSLDITFPGTTNGKVSFLPRDGLTGFLVADYVRTVYVVDGSDPLSGAYARVYLHTHYSSTDTLRLVDEDGLPVDAALVTVYRKTDYDAGDLTVPVGITTTDSDGRWVDAIAVASATTYTVHYQKDGVVGPVSVEIVVP